MDLDTFTSLDRVEIPNLVEEITTNATTRTVPAGAVSVIMEIIANGGLSAEDVDFYYGGPGGNYARRAEYTLGAATGLYIDLAVGRVRLNNSGGTILVDASTPGAPNQARFTGGVGATDAVSAGGGGAAGFDGNGGNASGATGGANGNGYQNKSGSLTGTNRGHGQERPVTNTQYQGGGCLLVWKF